MMGWSPQCYIPGFVEIGLPVPEKKIFKCFFFTIYGPGSHLGHATSIMSSDFHFHVPESFHKKIGPDRQSSFCKSLVLIFVCTRPGAKVKK